MRDDPAPPSNALDAAQQRLERALARLEQGLRTRASAPADARARQEHLRLESELQGVRTRERQLEQVAAEASAALGRAAAEVRAALQAEA